MLTPMTADEARAIVRQNDADAIEETAAIWANTDDRCGVDAHGDIWLTADTKLTDEQLVDFVSYAIATWN